MSDAIKHECGIALLRLRKPLQYYIDTYGSPSYAMKKMYLLMQKEHNRGQDGVGIANIKLDMEPGMRYISRYRTVDPRPIEDIFEKVGKRLKKAQKEGKDKYYDARWLKDHHPFTESFGWDIYAMGHMVKTVLKAAIPFYVKTTGEAGT